MTPEQLAAELGISAKTLRAWLRRNYPRPAAEKWSDWTLSPTHIAAARAWRASGHQPRPRVADSRPPGTPPRPATPSQIRWDPRFQRSFRRQRFRGFVPLGDAVADRKAFLREHAQDLDSAGAYAVFAPVDSSPTWKTPRAPPQNVIIPWPLAKLRDRWIDDVELVYIGCAGATSSSRTLSKRIGDLHKHGPDR